MQLFFSPDYVAARYAFDTTRKAGWIAESLRMQPITGLQLTEPLSVTEARLREVHDAAYVAAVKSGIPRDLAESQGFRWDPQLWSSACSSTGGVLAAARAALYDGVAGSLSSGLHHARRACGAGYCTFNGLALAALDALSQGARSVLILDLDAHCGGGTHSLLCNRAGVRHADIAVSEFDNYMPTDDNFLGIIHYASDYIPTLEKMLAKLERTGRYDLCLYNAGMDPHEDCSVGGLAGITDAVLADRERLVFDWCRKHACPVAFVLAGGYTGSALTQDELVALHRLTIETAALTIAAR